jgi:hypothetical protein
MPVKNSLRAAPSMLGDRADYAGVRQVMFVIRKPLTGCSEACARRQLAGQSLRHEADVRATLAAKFHSINLRGAVRAIHFSVPPV